jgi:hypothetical protein
MSVRIDRVRYVTAPRSTGRQMLSLGRLLRKYTPESASPDVIACAAALDAAIETGTQGYADRIRQDGPNQAKDDAEDDGSVDALLGIARDRIGHWQVFARPTYARLASAAPPDGVDYAELIDKAEQAARVHQLLFASDFDATRAPYPEQAEYMIALERIIDQAELGPVLDVLVGGPFVPELRRANVRYQAMVARRAAAERPDINLYEILTQLRVAVQNYLIALLAMIRDDDPDNVAAIRRALRPVDALREQLAGTRRGRSSDAAEPSEPSGQVEPFEQAEVDQAVEELAAEQQAVDAELGFVDGATDDPESPAAAG